jgi:hypothetical protein
MEKAIGVFPKVSQAGKDAAAYAAKELRLLSMERLLQEWQEQVSQLQHT